MELLTNTTISQFKNCRKAFYYRNMLQLVPRIAKKSRGIGSAVQEEANELVNSHFEIETQRIFFYSLAVAD